MPLALSRSVAALSSDVCLTYSSLGMIPASAPASSALTAPSVLFSMHPWASMAKHFAPPMSTLLMMASTSSPMIVLAQVETTATTLGWNLSLASFNAFSSGDAPPNMRSLSFIADVTTCTPAFSSGLEAMKEHPAGPWMTMTSTSMSLAVYIAATIGFGRGWMMALIGILPWSS